MPLVTINHHPSRQQLRTFGICWLLFFGLWSVWGTWRQGPTVTGVLLGLLAVGIPVAGLVWHEALRWVYVGMSYLTWPIGVVVSWLILALVFYAVMTPTALIMRLVGYDPLDRSWDPDAESYWIHREPPPPRDQYFRQY